MPTTASPSLSGGQRHVPKALVVLGRAGLAARGVVYLTVGGLAVLTALGIGNGKIVDQREAVAALGASPMGIAILCVVSSGLLSFILWRFGQVLFGTGSAEQTVMKAVCKRAVALGSGIAYTGIAAAAVHQVFGEHHRGEGGAAQRKGAAWLLMQPFGRWLVIGVGLAAIVAALFQWRRAITASFARDLQDGDFSAAQELWIRRAGRAGFAARGVAFALIGWFFVEAGLHHDPTEAGGLGAALQLIASLRAGPMLLGIFGAGLAMFGFYSLVESRYRRIG
jgi:uncharacterized protein DUF1206